MSNQTTSKTKGKKETPATQLGLKRTDLKVPKNTNRAPVKGPKPKRLDARILTRRRGILNKKKAKAYLELPEFKGERIVRDARVRYLKNLMLDGGFNGSETSIAVAELNGKEYKMNGQHTCWAVFTLDTANDDFCIEDVEFVRYIVPNTHQLRMLYDTFDRNLPRTDGHCAEILLMDLREFKGVVRRSSWKKLVQGWKFWQGPSKAHRADLDHNRITAQMQAKADLVSNVAVFLQDNWNNRDIKRQPVIAAIFAAFDARPRLASEFWEPVSTGLGFETKTDPRYVLRSTLNKAVLATRARGAKITYEPEDLFRICGVAWGHWRNKKEIKKLQSTKTRPKWI